VIPAPELVSLIANLHPGRALDIGCGGGTNICNVAEEVAGEGDRFCSVGSLDPKTKAKNGKMKSLQANISVGDATQMDLMDLGSPFQLALDIGCFHSLSGSDKSIQGYVRGLQHWLAAGGGPEPPLST